MTDPLVIQIHPVRRLLGDPMLMARSPGDMTMLQNLAATMPDWYYSYYGRNLRLWQGREIFYVRMRHEISGLMPTQVVMEFLFEIELNPHVHMSTCRATRKDSGPWQMVEGVDQEVWGSLVVLLELDMTFPQPHTEN